MSIEKRRTFAKAILIVYAFITATFPFSHKDCVPLGSRLSFLPGAISTQNLGSNDDSFVCPAHNFAQSTASTPVLEQDFTSPESFSFLRFSIPGRISSDTSRRLFARAPPQA